MQSARGSLRSSCDLPSAIAYLNAAIRHSEVVGDTHALPDFQSELSDLYRLTGNLSQAEVLARRAAESAQSNGNIPQIPKLLNILAQIQVSRKEYTEADQTYDRAATIPKFSVSSCPFLSAQNFKAEHFPDVWSRVLYRARLFLPDG